MINLTELVLKFKQHTGIGFISFPYRNAKMETSKLLVNIGISYANAKKRDLITLNNGVEYLASDKYTLTDWNNAIEELKGSLKIPDSNRSQGQSDGYIKLTKNGSLKWNINQQKLYIFGSLVRKNIIEIGEEKNVKSKPKTIAKEVIKKFYLRSGKLRTYQVDRLQGNIRINGDIIYVD